MTTHFGSAALALSSGVLFAIALVAQARGIQRPGRRATWWVGGTLVALAAYLLEVAALRYAPLALVSPFVAAGTVALPFVDRLINHFAIRATTLAAIVGILVGCSMLDVAGGPWRNPALVSSVSTWILVLGAPAAVTAALLFGRKFSQALMVGAAAAFVASGVASSAFARADDWRHAIGSGIVAVVTGILGAIAEQGALRSSSASTVGPAVLAMTTLGSVTLAPKLFAMPSLDGWRSWVGTALIIVASAFLTHRTGRDTPSV